MPRRLATFAIALGLALGAPTLGVVATTTACAATDERAALVVDTGTQARSYCVALGAGAVSGTELIRLAHEQYGLDYRLGFGGRAVCRLAGVGVDDGDCFGAYPDFWGYWHGDGAGGWTWAGASAADWTVEAGDIEGWQWGPGQDGATHAAPPPTTEEDVCRPLEPPPDPEPHGDGGGGGTAADPCGGGAANGATADDPSATGGGPASPPADRDRAGEDREPRDRVPAATSSPGPEASASPTGAPPVALAAGEAPGNEPGGGLGGALVALAAVAVLGGAGALVLRRRRAG
jgi:hypothetical protein